MLNDVYVNLYASYERGNIRDEDFLSVGSALKRIIFTATAGAGKSMVMRYFFFLSEQSERLPVFIELRDINDYPDSSILELIRDKIKEHISDFTVDQLKYALKEGMIALFLDGYDEIDHDRRIKLAREIISLAGPYNESIIFVSSRPDESFIGWERFHIYQLSPFTENQVRALLQKIPYDENIKALFVKKRDTGLYESHKEFLVNPLLTLMMLISLEQFAEIPAKIHLFYEYAFEALFKRHDVTKSGGFQRKRHVSIALDDYRRLFSYFCTTSYMKEAFRFTESSALETLSKSIVSSQIDVKKEDMLEDLVHCTCMLARDGLDYVFNHRSFQEYFVAYFFARIKVEEFERVAPRLMVRLMDNVFLMMSEMNKEKFEESWALPQLNSLCEITKEIDPAANPIGFVRAMIKNGKISALILEDQIGFAVDSSEAHDVTETNIRFMLYTIYEVFNRLRELELS
jgi:predicted NACHT family NTPase